MEEAILLLKKYWGYDNFRPVQGEIVQDVIDNKHCMALLPTGGGKSICYQIPGLLQIGITLVISPLISLMEDQVATLKNKGISAIALNAQLSVTKQKIALEGIRNGQYKFVYISPEKLISKNFQSSLAQVNISIIAIDEAHCISMWGYDFRPSYLRIIELINLFPNAKVLALTASATSNVVQDIRQNLDILDARLFRGSFVRKNLRYIILKEENKIQKIIEICKKLKGTGLVYTRNRKTTVEISRLLVLNNIAADYYHAGLSPEQRGIKQQDWTRNHQTVESIRILACTNAFGMGIDKPDVRFVIHLEPSPSLEYYYQEAGRAGRDGKNAFCIMLYNQEDIKNLNLQFENKFPNHAAVIATYNKIYNYYQIAKNDGINKTFKFDLNAFITWTKENSITIVSSLKLLQLQGVFDLSENIFSGSKIQVIADTQILINLQEEDKPINKIVQFLFRNYSGLYHGKTKIDEKKIAINTELPTQIVINILNRLAKIGLIIYEPQHQAHKITFLTARKEHFELNAKHIEKLKSNLSVGLDGMLKYIHDDKKCRNLQIAHYFDDDYCIPCGHCDNCLSIKRGENYNTIFEKYSIEIKKELKANIDKKGYLLLLNKNNKWQKLIVLQELIDRGIVAIKAEKIAWLKK